MDKLLLIDGNSIANRAYYAFASARRLTALDGSPTHAVFGFLNIVQKYVEQLAPTHVCVAFDLRTPTFRKELYAQYKATRKPMPEDLAAQMPVIKSIIDAFGYRRAEVERYEADDIIGALATRAQDAGLSVFALTGDRDALQLASNSTVVILPITRSGVTVTETYDEDAFIKAYGVTPSRFIDVKALMGDKSDNIPGIPGVGEKTAFELVKSFGGLDEIYANLEKIEKNSLREKLARHKETAYLCRRLSTIERDAPIGLTVEDLRVKPHNKAKLYKLFSELRFASYLTKMNLTALNSLEEDNKSERAPDKNEVAPLEPQTPQISQITKAPKTPQIVEGYAETERVARLLRGPFAIMPLFEKSDGLNETLFAIAAYSEGAGGFYFPCDSLVGDAGVENDSASRQKTIWRKLKPLLYGGGKQVIGHDVKRLYKWAFRYGDAESGSLRPMRPRFDFDAALAGYVVDSATGAYSIKDLRLAYEGGSVDEIDSLLGKGKMKRTLADVDRDTLARAAVSLAESCLLTWEPLSLAVSKNGQEDLLYGVEAPLSETLASMEAAGFYVDAESLKRYSDELDVKITSLEREIHDLAGEPFNVNSPAQLGDILYNKLGLPHLRKNKFGYSTDVEALASIADRNPIVGKVVEYRQHVKLKSTYADALPRMVNPETGRVHTTFNQWLTATGRLSCQEPNLQNIPVRLELGSEIRRTFKPQNDGWVLTGADYSQIELRVLAHLSGDEAMTDAFIRGVDIHRATAASVFHVAEKDVTSTMRTRAKAVNFGIVYGIGEFSLAKDIGVSRAEAKEYIEGYFRRFPGVRRFMAESVESGKETGFARTIMNRTRSLPELRDGSFSKRAFGERVAMNTPVQGSAADIIKVAMISVYKELTKRRMRSRLILQVHDELIVETRNDELIEVAGILKRAMENAVKLDVPLVADVYCGANWRDIKASTPQELISATRSPDGRTPKI